MKSPYVAPPASEAHVAKARGHLDDRVGVIRPGPDTVRDRREVFVGEESCDLLPIDGGSAHQVHPGSGSIFHLARSFIGLFISSNARRAALSMTVVEAGRPVHCRNEAAPW